MLKHITRRNVKDTVTLTAFAITLAHALKGLRDLGKSVSDVVFDAVDPSK